MGDSGELEIHLVLRLVFVWASTQHISRAALRGLAAGISRPAGTHVRPFCSSGSHVSAGSHANQVRR